MLVGALHLLIGERADRSLIRSGEDQCLVEAVVQLPDPAPIDAVLDEAGVERCAGGQLILRRSLLASGGGRNFINDCRELHRNMC